MLKLIVLVEPDAFSVHFGIDPPQLKEDAVGQADEGHWRTDRRQLPGFGRVAELHPGRASSSSETPSTSSSSRTTVSLLLLSEQDGC